MDMRLWACCAGRWHYCIAGPPWLTGGGQGEGGKGGRRRDESQREGWVRTAAKMKTVKGE